MADRHNRDLDRRSAPLPEPLPLDSVDTHVHLEIVTDSSPRDALIGEVLAAAASVGVKRVVQVGYSAEQSRWSVELAQSWPNVLAAVALHPNEAPVCEDLAGDLEEIERLAMHPKVRAIGETGLDFFRTPPELQQRQKDSFIRHIEIAKRFDKALVIHDRDAHRAVLDTLLEVGAPARTVFHCFSGDIEMARECVAQGYYLSFAGTVTFKNAPKLREALQVVPRDLLLVETDSPFLAPAPNRGAENSPAQIPHILRLMASERGEDLVEMITAINSNAERVFGSFD